MAKKNKNVHHERRLLEKLIQNLHTFMSNVEIAAKATIIFGRKIQHNEICMVKHDIGLTTTAGDQVTHEDRMSACLDRYDHRKIFDFLESNPKIEDEQNNQGRLPGKNERD